MPTGECEHCGRSDASPIVLHPEGKERSFCSTECVAMTEKEEGTMLWQELVRERDAIVAGLEKKRGSRVITMIHREEMHAEGEQQITIDNTEELLRKIRSVPSGTPIDFIIHCPGGVVLPAEQIALALKEHRGKVTAIVPYYAMSGATLVCLAADEIVMEPFSALGPLDPQIGGFPSPSLVKLVELKGPQYVSDQMVLLADVAAKSLRQMKSFIQHLLKRNMSEQESKRVADFMTEGYLTHDSPLTAGKLRSLGLNVVMSVPDDVHRFMKLHKLVSAPLPYERGEGGPHHESGGSDASTIGDLRRQG